MQDGTDIVAKLADARSSATVRQIIDEVVAQMGGATEVARLIATDLREAQPGSANRIRLTTALLRLMEQTQPADSDPEDLEELEDEAQMLGEKLLRQTGQGDDD